MIIVDFPASAPPASSTGYLLSRYSMSVRMPVCGRSFLFGDFIRGPSGVAGGDPPPEPPGAELGACGTAPSFSRAGSSGSLRSQEGIRSAPRSLSVPDMADPHLRRRVHPQEARI